MKIVAIILVVVILIPVLYLGVTTYNYMNKQGFDFPTALQWAWEDLTQIANKSFSEKGEILEFPMANANIEVVACTSLK